MGIIFTIIVLIIALAIYDATPLRVKVIITILSFVIMDPIPVLDELFFTFKLLGNISKVLKITDAVSGTGNSDKQGK